MSKQESAVADSKKSASFDKNKIIQDEVSATGKVIKPNFFIFIVFHTIVYLN
jgi:hypothetical protein